MMRTSVNCVIIGPVNGLMLYGAKSLSKPVLFVFQHWLNPPKEIFIEQNALENLQTFFFRCSKIEIKSNP